MTRFQIPIIGDVHLGPNARQPQRLAALRQITDAGHLLEDLAAWIYAGDLFHATSTAADRNLLAAILLSQADVAPVVIVRGNHDQEGDLEIFAKLGARYPIHVCEVAGVLSLNLANGGPQMALGVFPWPSEAALIAAGVPVAGIKDAARQALEPLFLHTGERLKAAAAAGQPVAWVGHATVTGAIASNGQPQVGHGIELDGSLLAALGPCPKFLGHIHKPQELADAGAHYVGSVCRLDFGEVEAKRYLVLEGEAIAEFCDHPLEWEYTTHDRPLEVPGMWHVDAELGLVDPIVVGQPQVIRVVNIQITRGPDRVEPPAEWVDQEVRFRLRYAIGLKAGLEDQAAYLRTMFAKAARFELELVAIPDGGLRAPAVAAAQTIEGKVRAWADASGTVLPSHLAEALELLIHNPAEGVLDDIQAMADELLKEGAPNAV